jgi:hypothetical protein
MFPERQLTVDGLQADTFWKTDLIVYMLIHNSVGTATGYGLDGNGSIPGRGTRFFFIPQREDHPLRPTQPPIQWREWPLSGDEAARA